jgi:Type IV secretion system pilin
MRNNLLRIFAIVGLLGFLILPPIALAQTHISASIPGTNSNGSAASPGAWIANFYQFALLIGGILAFGAIVFGGVKYAASVGNPSAQSDAKEWIEGALIGLLLLAGVYLILYVINPNLVNLNMPQLGGIGNTGNPLPPVPPPTNPTSTSTCPIQPLPANPNPPTISWTSSDPAVQQNLNALQTAYGKFQTAIASVGDHGTLNSVYRPLAYQTYLYAIYQGAMALSNNPSASSNPSCTSIISALQAAEQAHQICQGGYPATPGHSCLVGAPNACAPHVAGIGIDITLSGPVSNSALNSTLSAQNVGLYFRGLPGDPVHFQLTNPPAGSCPS